MTVAKANFGALLEPGLATVFFNEFDRWQPEYSQYLKIKQSAKQREQELLIVGMGLMSKKIEGSSVTYEDISQGYTTTYTHDTFAKAIRITQEMYEDDLYGIMKDMTTALARSAMQRKEVDAASILNNAFSTSFTGADGAALISATHTLSITGTQSNAMGANTDLTVAGLQEAIGIIEKCQDEKGLNVALRPSLLVVPPDLQWIARELIGSEYKPDTSDNNINSFRDKGLKFMVCHYLTDTDAWFLLADEHKLTMFERLAINFYKGNDFDTDDVKFKGRMRYSKGFSDWRGVVGNAGV